MRLLADENIPLASIRALRRAGIDVATPQEGLPGRPDEEVLERASIEERILTFSNRTRLDDDLTFLEMRIAEQD